MTQTPLLEPEQEGLLATLVEASRSVRREDRQRFYFIETYGAAGLQHPGLGEDAVPAYRGDIEVLGREGLLIVEEPQPNVLTFDVTPLGFHVYADLKARTGEPVVRMERELRSFLDSAGFQTRHLLAYRKWSEAESLLWRSETGQHLTIIGHLCREALQEFADSIAKRFNLREADAPKADTVRRIRSALSKREGLGERPRVFLEALLAYWGTLTDLVQRQEHGAQKEGPTLQWEDARRIVFQSVVVMMEIDKALT